MNALSFVIIVLCVLNIILGFTDGLNAGTNGFGWGLALFGYAVIQSLKGNN